MVLIRGTEVPPLTLRDSPYPFKSPQFGPFSASAFVTLRQRMNMNAVRLPVIAREYLQSGAYRARTKEVVRQANRFELAVILAAADHAEADFWSLAARDFQDNPNLFYAIGAGEPRPRIDAIRAAGATQPILFAGSPEFAPADPNLIYEAAASYTMLRTDADRWAQFGRWAERVPVLANGLDPELDQDSAECAAFPKDPAVASSLLEENLTYFDHHAISWTISSLRAGRLVSDYRYFTWTKLDDGWTCGVSPTQDGIAMLLLSHLWNTDPHGLFAVSQTRGGFLMARGSTSTAYGPIMADREMSGGKSPYPTVLGNISVRVTDSRGVARLARLLHTGGGWSQVSFVVPDSSAPGPAEVAIVRADGTNSAAGVVIADVAPGIWSASMDGRGPAIAWVQHRSADGRITETPAWECSGWECRTVPIPMSSRGPTWLRVEGTGFRHAGPKEVMRVAVGDVVLPVISFGPTSTIGRDQLTVELPPRLRGIGEADMVLSVDGVLSNVVRIHCGAL